MPRTFAARRMMLRQRGKGATVPPPSGAFPSVPSTGGFVSLTLAAAATGTHGWSVGHTFKQGDMPAGQGLSGVQCTVKSTWPDGSAKVAVLAGGCAMTAGASRTVSLVKATAPTGSALTTAELKATGITAGVAAGAFGSASWSGTDWDVPFQSWVSGPLMSSWVYRKPIGSDAHLVAWLEVRLWASGAVEVLPWIENGYIRVAGAVNKSATYAFTLGGTSRFSAPIDLPCQTRTPLLSGTALSHWLGADPGVTPKHDTAYLQSTRLVPSYRANVAANDPVVTSLPATFAPLQLGSFTTPMGNGGYQSAIGLLPEWDVLYLTTTAPAAYGGVVRNGYSAGRWDTHYRDENTNRPLRFSQFPNISLNASTTNDFAVGPTGTSAPSWDIPHHPSVGFLAYLVTGRFYFMEEVQFAATKNYLQQVDNQRGFSGGYFKSNAGANTTRGAGWALRTLAQAATVTPDADAPLRAEFIASLQANVDYVHARYIAQAHNPFGIVTTYGDAYGGPADGSVTEAPWQQDFYTASWGYALAMNPPISSPSKTKMAAFFDWKARSVVGRLGAPGANNWLYRDAAQYNFKVAFVDNPDWDGGTGPWPSSWRAMYDATFAGASPGAYEAGDLRGGNYPEASSYWANLQPAIAYAVEHGVADAEAGYLRMVQAGNWPALRDNFATTPVWSVKPPVEPGLPAWLPVGGSGLAVNVNINSLSSVNPCPTNNCWYSQQSRNEAPFRNWNGAAYAWGASQYGSMHFWGGGHGGGEDTSIYSFDFTTGLWSRTGPMPPTTDFTGNLDTTWYDFLHEGSYIVAGLHSYSYPTYVPPGVAGAGPKGSWLLPQLVGGTTTNGASGGAQPHAVDLDTGVWSRFTTNVGVTTGAETFASSLYDSIRNRVYWAGSGSSVLNYIDYNEAHPRAVKQFTLAGSYGFGLYYGIHVFVPEANMAVGFGCLYGQDAVKGEVINFATGVPAPVFNFSGTPWPLQTVAGAGFGVDWCPDTQAFYIYEGNRPGPTAGTNIASTRVLKLKPATLNFASTTWTWSEEQFLNPAAGLAGGVGLSGAQPFTRWRWINALKAFCWTDGPGASGVCRDGQTHDGLMQLWRPAGV